MGFETEDIDEKGEDGYKYSWDENYQRDILTLLLHDRVFLTQAIDLIKPNYFMNKAHVLICNVLFDFFQKYRNIPTRNYIQQEIKVKVKNEKTVFYYLGELATLIQNYVPNLDTREYLLDKVTTFAKIQALRLAYAKTGEILEQNPEDEDTWIKIYDILRNAMTISKNFEIGLEYFKNMNERYERLEARNNPTENFITSFETIDVNLRGGGLRRGQVGAFVAGSGVGKSIALSNVAAANVRRGKRILYISLELDEDTVSERLDAIFTGEPIELLSARKKLIFDELNKVVEDYEDKNLIIIKDFPAGTADVNTFRAYIAQLSFYGFKPDMVIVDYVGEMKNHPNLKTYESRERSIRELRALAKEEDVCVLTAMQLNRGHKDAEEGAPIDERYLADSFGQTRPLDACWSIGVSKIEHELGIGRIYAIKHRDGKSKFQFFIEFNKMNLQITEISRETYNTKRSLYKEKNIGDVVIDDIDSQRKKKKKKRTEEEDDDGDGVLESV